MPFQCISFWLKGDLQKETHEKIKISPSSIPLLSPLDPSVVISGPSLLETGYWIEQVPHISKNLSYNSLISQYSLLSFAAEGFFDHQLGRDTESQCLSLTSEKSFLDGLGTLWKRGAVSQWAPLYDGCNYSRAALPGYPFEKKTLLDLTTIFSFLERRASKQRAKYSPRCGSPLDIISANRQCARRKTDRNVAANPKNPKHRY